MSAAQSIAVLTGVFFLFILLIGIWLSRTGRPRNGFILSLHKLVSLAAAAYPVVNINRFNQAAAIQADELAASIATGVLFLGAAITGGFLSTDRQLPKAIVRLHIEPIREVP